MASSGMPEIVDGERPGVRDAGSWQPPAIGGWHLVAAGLTITAIAWATLLVALPRQLEAGRAARLGAVVYLAASAVCHQRPERSFHRGGVRMPVCARCAGLYVAGAVGLFAGWFGARREPRRAVVLVTLAAALLPMGLSVALEWGGVAHSSNAARAATGAPAGAVAGWLVVRLLRSAPQAMRYHLAR